MESLYDRELLTGLVAFSTSRLVLLLLSSSMSISFHKTGLTIENMRLSSNTFSAIQHGPSLRNLGFKKRDVTEAQLVDFFERHASTLRELSIEEVEIYSES